MYNHGRYALPFRGGQAPHSYSVGRLRGAHGLEGVE